MKTHRLILFQIALLLFSCQNDGEDDYYSYVVYLNPKIDEIDMKLSSIARHSRLIHLETNAECIITRMSQLVYLNKEHIIYRSDKKILLFDKEGRYINKIDALGEGPEEYSTIKEVSIDAKNKHIYIVDNKDIKVYDFEANFIQAFQLDNIPAGLYVTASGQFIVPTSQHYAENNREMLTLYDSSMTKIKSFRSTYSLDFSFTQQQLFFAGNPYELAGEVYFKEPFVDTIYRLTDTTLYPHWIVNMGKYKMDAKEELNIENQNTALSKGKILHPGIFETSNYFFFKYYSGDALYLSLFAKNEKAFFFHKKLTHQELERKGLSQVGITNDFLEMEDSLPFWPNYINGNTIVSVVFPEDMTETLRNDIGCNKDDNPVLVEVTI